MTVAVKEIRLPWLLKSIQGLEFPHKLGFCDRIFGRTLATHGVCWVPTAASIPWKLDLVNSTHRWIVYGKYEGIGFFNWAKGFLPPDGIVVDSGANIGQVLLYLAQWVPDGQVLAFEPSEVQADWLEECVIANKLESVEVLRLGLGSKTANLALIEAGLSERHGAQYFVSPDQGVPIKVVTLDEELERRGVARVDLWKLDVEGYELEALRGAKSLFRQKAIRAVYVEMQESLQAEIMEFFHDHGYRGFTIDHRGELKRATQFDSFSMGLFLPN